MQAQDFLSQLTVDDKTYRYYDLNLVAKAFGTELAKLPKTHKILLENIVRNQFSKENITAFANWVNASGNYNYDLSYLPARVLMQDFTGVPAVVDLAAMRDAVLELGGDPTQINPKCPVDLVIDHSISVDEHGHAKAFGANGIQEMIRNRERYKFLKWGQESLSNFRVVPPGTGICHQVNIEHLANVVSCAQDLLYPDTLVGTDSHTTMVNGLGVLGWGVGGIEAEAVMLGLPISIKMPEVVGVRLIGKLSPIATATDMVLSVTQMLRAHGVVGKFVEFLGPGINSLSLADRATLANMAPEYGATCGFAPIDSETIAYMQLTGRSDHQCKIVEAYAKAQGLWSDDNAIYTETLDFDLSGVEPCLAGPKRPQDKVLLSDVSKVSANEKRTASAEVQNGDVVLAAITSCTNTSNPKVMIAAGLLAKAANARGLRAKPWVKCSLAPGSKVVVNYLEQLGLLKHLDAIGFNLVGFGCTTCIGNSGPLPEPVSTAIAKKSLNVAGVLSGNRNFEGRIHPLIRDNWLASPPLVVAYSILGTTTEDITQVSLGEDSDGNAVYLQDLWPSADELNAAVATVAPDMFSLGYQDVFAGDKAWQDLPAAKSHNYSWQADSTYVRKPTFFDSMTRAASSANNINNARILAILGDSVTTDHISPAGVIQPDSPAGKYLQDAGISVSDFNSYGSRRGNHEVMMRGTFANIRLKNSMADGKEGGYTKSGNEIIPIYDAAQASQAPMVVFAGLEYGTGSSRDWAAKGTSLLGVKCVIAKSFERIHRSNLIGMGVLPCQAIDFDHTTLTGDEMVSILGLENMTQESSKLSMVITKADGSFEIFELLARIDTAKELEYFMHGGILQYVIRQKIDLA